VFCQGQTNGMIVCYLSPKAGWDARVRSGLLVPLLMALALLVCTWPLSAIVSRALSRSTKELSAAMQKFREGDFSQQVQVRGEDEIGQMSLAFNQMATDVRELIEKNYVMALRERESELDALQAQINPHFLYNAMDSLYWQAEETGLGALAEDILALSKLFRLLLSQGKSEIPVRSEIELIGYYLQIQKMRFSQKLSYEIDVEEAVMDCLIPKLTLQPFVENAIVHGLEKSIDGGFVKIRGRLEGDRMAFAIEDNGVGMRQEDADRMLKAGESGNYVKARIGHYAISNIKERLVLRYGKSAGLDIRSDPSMGTMVRVTLPASELQVGGGR
jgi:two-component system sensor histidine kinase YesM